MAWLTTTTGWDWAGLQSEIELYFGVTVVGGTAQEQKLKSLLLAALKAGDQYMQNPWNLKTTAETPYTLADYRRAADYDEDPTNGTDVTPPDDVKTGVFEWMGWKWATMLGDGGPPAAPAVVPPGMVVSMRKTDSLQESYAKGQVVGGGVGGSANLESSRFNPFVFWQPYKMEMFL